MSRSRPVKTSNLFQGFSCVRWSIFIFRDFLFRDFLFRGLQFQGIPARGSQRILGTGKVIIKAIKFDLGNKIKSKVKSVSSFKDLGERTHNSHCFGAVCSHVASDRPSIVQCEILWKKALATSQLVTSNTGPIGRCDDEQLTDWPVWGSGLLTSPVFKIKTHLK